MLRLQQKLLVNLALVGSFESIRTISTSATLHGKRNFRKFIVANKRGSRLYKENQRTSARELPIDKRGVRDIGVMVNDRFVVIPERIPELIVPDLTDCKLKPYVSYKTPDIVQSEFTSEDLFNVVYAPKILDDIKAGKLDADGNPLEPSEDERISAEQAIINARKTGSDIF